MGKWERGRKRRKTSKQAGKNITKRKKRKRKNRFMAKRSSVKDCEREGKGEREREKKIGKQ